MLVLVVNLPTCLASTIRGVGRGFVKLAGRWVDGRSQWSEINLYTLVCWLKPIPLHWSACPATNYALSITQWKPLRWCWRMSRTICSIGHTYTIHVCWTYVGCGTCFKHSRSLCAVLNWVFLFANMQATAKRATGTGSRAGLHKTQVKHTKHICLQFLKAERIWRWLQKGLRCSNCTVAHEDM